MMGIRTVEQTNQPTPSELMRVVADALPAVDFNFDPKWACGGRMEGTVADLTTRTDAGAVRGKVFVSVYNDYLRHCLLLIRADFMSPEQAKVLSDYLSDVLRSAMAQFPDVSELPAAAVAK